MPDQRAYPKLVVAPVPYLQFENARFPIEIRRSARASRMKLRIDPRAGVVLVLPLRVPVRNGLAFLEQELGWIASKIGRIPVAVPFRDGETLPLLGVPHRITHAPDRRGRVWQEDGNLFVTGRPEHLPRRVRDWVRASARTEIGRRAEVYASVLDIKPKGISLRDQKTRWGSCSSTGRLNFSWRLLLMPEEVMSYIVAHEVAHLRHMNHSPAFWKLVGELHSGVAPAKKWLKTHGADIHKYGVEIEDGL